MVCHECRREAADGFSFCPHCGRALPAESPTAESPTPPLEVQVAIEGVTVAPEPAPSLANNGRNEIGTYVFVAFALFSLLVSLKKGVVPLYLIESAIWGGAAWYWHRTKTHSERGKAIVIVIAVLVAIGEVIHIAPQSDFQSERITPAIPGHSPAPPTPTNKTFPGSEFGGVLVGTESAPSSTISVDSQGTTNMPEPRLKSEPQPRKKALTGLQATVSCDVVAYDRDKYGEGDARAIATVHQGDTVPYVGHVTVGDEEIIRVHGRRGYVSGCIDVKLDQITANSNQKNGPKSKKETHTGLEATITCDAIVWDRDKYGAGDPIAIATVHQGDTVPYVGHVTIGDEEIIQVHGRRGYVSGCVDVKP